MLARLILTGALLVAVGASPVLACQGDEIFSDDFSDQALSKDVWGDSEWFSVEKGYLQIKNKPNYRSIARIPLNQAEFDVCADIIYPASANPENTIGGFGVWFKDWDNYYEVITTSVGGVGAFRTSKGRFMALGTFKVYPALKSGAGSTNTLRLTVKGNTGTVYGNGQRLFAFRMVAADAQASGIGVSLLASSEKERENDWRFTNVKLTEPPK